MRWRPHNNKLHLNLNRVQTNSKNYEGIFAIIKCFKLPQFVVEKIAKKFALQKSFL